MTSAVAGAALLGALPASAGAEDGAVGTTCLAPADAAGIDALLGRAASPLAGQGATFVAEGVAAGIDPRLLLAIAAHETRFATYAPARAIHNPFGLGPGMVFTSDAAAIARAARTLDSYYVQEGRIRIDTIGPKWAPIGAANDPKGLNRRWVAGVSTQYAALGGDPGEPVLIGAQGASCAAPTPEGAASTPPAATDRSSGPAEVTTLAGATLMICLVGYLAARRRRVVLAAADARDSRFSWEREGTRASAPPPRFADEMTAAHAQSAATASEALSIAWASEEAIEDAEWTLEDPPQDTPTGEDDAATEESPGGDEAPTQAIDEALPAPAAAPGPAEGIDPQAAYWAWAQDESAEHGDAEQPDWPIGWRPVEDPAPTPPPAVVEPEPADVVDVTDQAAIVADLVPALLEGILPVERVCDRAGVTPRMLALMRIVADTPLPVTEQARRLGLPRTLVAGLCARMEKLGLAQREPLADDARRHAVTLTPAGYELCADSAPAPDAARVEAVLARMSPAERAALLASLTALASPSAV